MKPIRVSLILLTAIVTGLPAIGLAKDTDVYLAAPGISRDDSPNVLIVFDTSGSMETNSIVTGVSYDAATVYVGGYDPNKIYWAASSASPPPDTTEQWFDVSHNKCTDSSFQLSSSPGARGFYTAQIFAWRWKVSSGVTSTTQGRWLRLDSNAAGTNADAARKIADVECRPDDPADATLGQYLTRSSNSNLAYSSRYTNSTRFRDRMRWSEATAPTLFSGNYLNFKASTPPPVTQTRMQIAKEAIKTVIDTNHAVRFGIMVFNRNNLTPHGGRIAMKIDTMDDARRTAMKNLVDGLSGYVDPPTDMRSNYTPLSETLWEAYRYFGGKSVTYGNPVFTPLLPPVDECAQGSFPAPCKDDGTYESPFTLACQKGYIIYMTDGDPTNDSDANSSIDGLPGVASGSGNRLDELAEWMSENDLYDDLTGVQTAITYTIGFGSGISASGLQLLQDTANKSGGKYYPAADADQLAAAVQSALFEALTKTTSFVAPALSVNAFNTLFNRDEVYFAVFKPSTTTLWDGNLKKYTLCKGTEVSPTCTFGEVIDQNGNPAVDPTTLRIKETARSYWSSTADGNDVDLGGAGENIPTAGSRNIYTYTGGYTAAGLPTGGQTDLTHADNGVATANTVLTQAMLNVGTAAERDAVINWIRGVDVRDEDTDGDTTEDRYRFHDPVHSRPVAVTYGGDNADPIIKMFVGTNDGMLRMINERTGVEEWAFMPQELLAAQNALSLDEDGNHLWGMDGTPSFHIQDKSGTVGNVVDLPDGIIDPAIGDFVHLFLGMRRGGRNIYALDLTPAATITDFANGHIDPTLMWVIRGGVTTGFSLLGQTWSTPSVAQIRYGNANAGESEPKTVLMFGGGYDDSIELEGTATPLPASIAPPTATMGNAIFMVDPATGERLWWASGATTGADLELTGMDYAIPSDLTLMDANGDGETDRIYVGDLRGQIWRIDLDPTLKQGSSGLTSGYKLADLACTDRSGTMDCSTPDNQDVRKFFYPPNVAQVNDSVFEDAAEAKYDVVTIASGDREDPIDLLTLNQIPEQVAVHNRIYVLRDYITQSLDDVALTYPATITEDQLYDATIDNLLDATEADIITSGIRNTKGWLLNLLEASAPLWIGEKGLARTVIFGGQLFATTYIPANEQTAVLTCQPDEGIGRLWAFDILSGAAGIDFDGDGNKDRSTDVGGGIPSDLVVVIREGGVSGLVGPHTPPNLPKDLPRRKTFWFQ